MQHLFVKQDNMGEVRAVIKLIHYQNLELRLMALTVYKTAKPLSSLFWLFMLMLPD